MKRKRRIIAYVATSADGYIARPDGDVAWLDRPRPKGNYGMGEFLKTIDTILWGRKTYGLGIEKGMSVAGFGKGVKNYVFSRQSRPSVESGVEFVSEPIKTFAQRTRSQPGKDIWMMGGAGVIASFLDEGAIDEFIIHVVPIFIGEGIPLIEARRRSVRLKLLSSRNYPDGVVRLHYAVQQVSQAAAKRADNQVSDT
jgi:dihydrofolate reductase